MDDHETRSTHTTEDTAAKMIYSDSNYHRRFTETDLSCPCPVGRVISRATEVASDWIRVHVLSASRRRNYYWPQTLCGEMGVSSCRRRSQCCKLALPNSEEFNPLINFLINDIFYVTSIFSGYSFSTLSRNPLYRFAFIIRDPYFDPRKKIPLLRMFGKNVRPGFFTVFQPNITWRSVIGSNPQFATNGLMTHIPDTIMGSFYGAGIGGLYLIQMVLASRHERVDNQLIR